MNRLLPLLALLAAVGCQPRFDGLEVTLYSNPPVPVRVSDQEIEMSVGLAVAIDVEPQSSTRFGYYPDDPMTLRSQDRAVLRVEPLERVRRQRLRTTAAGPGQRTEVTVTSGTARPT